MRVEGVRFEGKRLLVTLSREFTAAEKAEFFDNIQMVLDEMNRVWRKVAEAAGGR